MNKRLIGISIFTAISCGIVSLPSTADISHESKIPNAQTIKVYESRDLLDKISQFNRLQDIKIIETQPHLKKSNQQIRLSSSELISILKEAGFEGLSLKWAWAVAMQESTAKPYAFNKSSNCYGLFQINMTGSMGPSRREKFGLEDNIDLFDPLVNAKVAYHMSAKGTNWSAWVNHKAIKQWLSEYPY